MKLPNHIVIKQWATLLDAGIPILQSAEMLSESLPDPQYQKLFATLHQTLKQGKNLKKSLDEIPHPFSAYTIALMHIGEQTGTLTYLLNQAAIHLEQTQHLQQKINETLHYPAWVSALALITMLGLFIFIVPRFAELYQANHVALPTLTRYILGLASFLQLHVLQVLGLLGLLIIFFKILTWPIAWQAQKDIFLLKIPLFRDLLLTHFLKTLACLYQAGIPIDEAMHLLATLSNNYQYKSILLKLRSDLNKGMALHQAMLWQAFFPKLLISLIQNAESSGTLGVVLQKSAVWHQETLDFKLNTLRLRLEPLIILILGVLIGILSISLYLPIFKLGAVI